MFLKLRFNATDDNENRCAGWHRHFARFDVFGFLIRGFWARWQRATRALFSHFRVVVAIFCYKMHFHIFWSLGKIFWWKSWQCQLCRRTEQKNWTAVAWFRSDLAWFKLPTSWNSASRRLVTLNQLWAVADDRRAHTRFSFPQSIYQACAYYLVRIFW